MSDVTNEILQAEVERLQQENERMQHLLERPVQVSVNSAENHTLQKIEQYLPQLTHIATNLSYVSSAITTQTATLDRLVKLLEEKMP